MKKEAFKILNAVTGALVLLSGLSVSAIQVDPVVVSAQDQNAKSSELEETKEGLLEDFLSETPEFNFFEGTSLNSFQSLSPNGIDQRFVDLSYNGFSLRDPSNPTGVFNISLLNGLIGKQKFIKSGGKLLIESQREGEGFIEFSASQLGEADFLVQQNSCSEDSCHTAGVSIKRGGGFSQQFGGDEADYFKRLHLNFDEVHFTNKFEVKTHMFYSGQRYDEDRVGLFSSSEPESLVAISNAASFFVGRTYKVKDLSFGGSYLKSHRSQKNDESFLKFSQQSDVGELQVSYKNLSGDLFVESFDLGQSKGIDEGIRLSYHEKEQRLKYNAVVEFTRLRNLYGSFEASYKGIGVFFNAEPASLFQSFYNREQSGGDLGTQNLMGLQYKTKWKISKLVQQSFSIVYSHAFDFIEYDLLNDRYQNLDEVQTVLLKLSLQTKCVDAYVQNQYSEVKSLQRELANRPPWTFGLRSRAKILGSSLNLDLKWVSERLAFDGSELGSFLDSSLEWSYKGYSIEMGNLLDQSGEVFRGLSRRPFTLELKYRKTF